MFFKQCLHEAADLVEIVHAATVLSAIMETRQTPTNLDCGIETDDVQVVMGDVVRGRFHLLGVRLGNLVVSLLCMLSSNTPRTPSCKKREGTSRHRRRATTVQKYHTNTASTQLDRPRGEVQDAPLEEQPANWSSPP